MPSGRRPGRLDTIIAATRRKGAKGAVAGAAVAAALVVSACTVSSVLSPIPDVDIGVRTAAVGTLAGYPRFGLGRGDAMPAEEAACRRQLKRLGVRYTDLPPINDGGACRIDHPVEVHALSGGIAMQPAATLSCDMAAAFALWTKKELAPAARFRYLSGVKAINQGSSYSCRNIAGTRTASEHSKGNALDVMSIELNNGREIDVRRPGLFAFRQRSLLNTVRSDGCDYFTTVLGPGYDAAHRDHFHFDVKDRRNGYRACK